MIKQVAHSVDGPGSADLVLSEVCGFSGGNMGKAADLQRTQVCATHYMHNNPVRRGLVAQPGDWPWSSWRYYYLDDSSVLAMDRLP